MILILKEYQPTSNPLKNKYPLRRHAVRRRRGLKDENMKELHEAMIFQYLLRELNEREHDLFLCRDRLGLSSKSDELDALEFIIAKAKYDYALQTLVNINRIFQINVNDSPREKAEKEKRVTNQ